MVRCRVGVNSTTIVTDGVTAALSPVPTKKRRIANRNHDPLGMNAISPELIAHIKVPITTCFLRPHASANAPDNTAPTMAPIPPL